MSGENVAWKWQMPVTVEGWYALARNIRRDPPLTRPHDPEFLAAAQFEDGTWEPVLEVRYRQVEYTPPGSVFRQFMASIERGFDIFIAGQFYPMPYWGEFQVHQVEHLPFRLSPGALT